MRVLHTMRLKWLNSIKDAPFVLLKAVRCRQGAYLTSRTTQNERMELFHGRNSTALVLATVLVWAVALCPGVSAQPRIRVDVKTILASQNGPPKSANTLSGYGLAQPLVQDLRSVFRYSSYRIIGENQMSLQVGQTGSAVLPGRRRLDVTPLSIANDRAQLRLELQRDNRQVFQTVIQLLNHGNLIVGGPKHKNGVLLFKVTNNF